MPLDALRAGDTARDYSAPRGLFLSMESFICSGSKAQR